MNEIIRPVRFGILIGLIGIAFGIFWAFYLVLGHEQIHQSFEERRAGGQEHSFLKLMEPAAAYAHSGEDHSAENEQHRSGNDMGHDMHGSGHEHGGMEEAAPHSAHNDPVFELGHRRLTRGHLHAMGLGLVTLAVSFVLAFTGAPEMIKTAASILTGIGGLIYPFAWIVMGYRTASLGPDAAEASVTTIAGPGVALVLLGIFTAIVFLLKDIFSEK